MALILALVLAIFWIIRLSSEKTAIKKSRDEYDTIKEQDESRKKAWEINVINRELEARLEDGLYHEDQSLLQEVCDSWNEYFVDGSVEKFYISRDQKAKLILPVENACSDYTALRILLANRGYLTYNDAIFGIDFFANGDTEYQRLMDYKRQEYFILAINDKLKKRGIDEKMYSVHNYTVFHQFPFPKDTVFFEGSILTFGAVKWRPEISTFQLYNNRV